MTLVVVDGANVVGSVPDGWWHDRLGAARRLRDSLSTVDSLPDVATPLRLVLVVEGAAASLAEDSVSEPVSVVAADGSGDDTIVDVVTAARAGGEECVVVTADRLLRERVQALGAGILGPRALPYAARTSKIQHPDEKS